MPRPKTKEEVRAIIEEAIKNNMSESDLCQKLGWTMEEYRKYLETSELPDPELRSMND